MPVYQLPPGQGQKPRRARGSQKPLHFEQGFPTHQHRLYGDPRWRKLRAAFIAKFGSVCQDEAHDNRYPREGSVELDHVEEVSDNPARAFDPTNLTLRCHRCHRNKTVEVAKQRMRDDYWRHMALVDAERLEQLENEKKAVSGPGDGENDQ